MPRKWGSSQVSIFKIPMYSYNGVYIKPVIFSTANKSNILILHDTGATVSAWTRSDSELSKCFNGVQKIKGAFAMVSGFGGNDKIKHPVFRIPVVYLNKNIRILDLDVAICPEVDIAEQLILSARILGSTDPKENYSNGTLDLEIHGTDIKCESIINKYGELIFEKAKNTVLSQSDRLSPGDDFSSYCSEHDMDKDRLACDVIDKTPRDVIAKCVRVEDVIDKYWFTYKDLYLSGGEYHGISDFGRNNDY